MLTVEPDEPVIHDVRVQHAYRTTVTLRNNSRNALELTIRAGSPERWAVAPSTVFLEAGRTMRVDLRLKLTRELRPKRLAGGAGAAADHASGEGTQQAPHRQRDVFHIKTPYFERRFHASFTVADESEPRKEVPIEDRGRSVSFAPSASGGGAGALRDRARSASPRRFRGDDEIARETRRAVSAPRRRPEGQDVARLDRDAAIASRPRSWRDVSLWLVFSDVTLETSEVSPRNKRWTNRRHCDRRGRRAAIACLPARFVRLARLLGAGEHRDGDGGARRAARPEIRGKGGQRGLHRRRRVRTKGVLIHLLFVDTDINTTQLLRVFTCLPPSRRREPRILKYNLKVSRASLFPLALGHDLVHLALLHEMPPLLVHGVKVPDVHGGVVHELGR